MAWPTIHKAAGTTPSPNLADYDAARASFSWDEARLALDGLPGGRGLNIAHEAVDRHATGATSAKVALRWLGRRGEREDLTYAELAAPHQPLRQRPRPGWAWSGASGCSCCCRPVPSCTSPRSAR